MSRLLIVSNRLPVTVVREAGRPALQPSSGGLATGLASFHKSKRSFWVGWPGTTSPVADDEADRLRRLLARRRCRPVFLSRSEVDGYYRGFSNRTIWPLFHYFMVYTEFDSDFWRSYREVNERFAAEVAEVCRPGDSVWVHDYHLLLLPGLLRRQLPDLAVGFFLHIPFPSFEVFRSFPWRREVLEGLLGADLVGFHSYNYSRHFISSVRRVLDCEHESGRIRVGERNVIVDAFPMGIDYRRFAASARSPEVQRAAERTRRLSGNRRIILSVDRLDYTKGIVQRLEAYDSFLERWPEYRGQVTMVLLVVPSRIRVPDYVRLKQEVDRLVGRVNGRYGTVGWSPILYLYRSVPFETLCALYRAADVALVTPLRDGMNLVAKEYVACRADGHGVLVLSEMAGAADELGEALIVNPNHRTAVAEAIERALSMPEPEQRHRNRLMQERLKRYDVLAWASDFSSRLQEAARRNFEVRRSKFELAGPLSDRLVTACRRGRRRLLFLDYDGTLVSFAPTPDKAPPDARLLQLLRRLGAAGEVVLISGRDRPTLEKWFGETGCGLVAEHGVWLRPPGTDWQLAMPLSNRWKGYVRPILERYVDRTPGSLLEEKEYALVWHYRRVAPELAQLRVGELRAALIDLTANLELDIIEGNRVIEVKNAGIGKGHAALHWLSRRRWDFVFAAGDDRTDEDLFAALPDKAWSVKVGTEPSRARFWLGSPGALRGLLERMVEHGPND